MHHVPTSSSTCLITVQLHAMFALLCVCFFWGGGIHTSFSHDCSHSPISCWAYVGQRLFRVCIHACHACCLFITLSLSSLCCFTFLHAFVLLYLCSDWSCVIASPCFTSCLLSCSCLLVVACIAYVCMPAFLWLTLLLGVSVAVLHALTFAFCMHLEVFV